MKKTLYTLAMLLLATLCLPSCSDDAEEPVVVPEEEEEPGTPSLPLLVEGRSWVIHLDNCNPTIPEDYYKSYAVLTVKGDSLWEGKTYKKMMANDIEVKDGVWGSYPEYCSFIMREQNGRVYRPVWVYDMNTGTGTHEEAVDFDCNTPHGSGWQEKDELYGSYTFDYTWDLSDTITADGIKRRTWALHVDEDMIWENGYNYRNSYIEDVYIEGIGYIGSSFYHDHWVTGSTPHLVCCHDADGTCLYSREPDHDCPLKAKP